VLNKPTPALGLSFFDVYETFRPAAEAKDHSRVSPVALLKLGHRRVGVGTVGVDRLVLRRDAQALVWQHLRNPDPVERSGTFRPEKSAGAKVINLT
jgi:hypothetical protein